MNTGRFQPQMSQMNADVLLKIFICAHLRNLRLNKALKELSAEAVAKVEILEKIGWSFVPRGGAEARRGSTEQNEKAPPSPSFRIGSEAKTRCANYARK